MERPKRKAAPVQLDIEDTIRSNRPKREPPSKPGKLEHIGFARGPLRYHAKPSGFQDKEEIRWYVLGNCNVAFVEVFVPGTRQGTKGGSNFCVHMAHRRKETNAGDWFDTEKEVNGFIIEQITGEE